MPHARRLVATALAASCVPALLALPRAVATPGPPVVGGASTPATAALARMTLAQQVGQVFMAGTPATSADPRTLRAISRRHVGSVILTGRSYHGPAAPRAVVRRMQSRATDGVRLLVATDQEGGLVQVLQGPGFSAMPRALQQGGWTTSHLQAAATTWATQLRSVGVNVDLAPVADTVPSARAAQDNPPIGVYDREFGYTVRRVTRHARAFALGMLAGGVAPTVKHFPGLGRVTANTDTSRGVTDHVTTRHDAYVRPFAAAVHAGVPLVMVSSAYYARIDPHRPAVFSPTVVRSMLRGDLGFRGVVVSDDLGNAQQLAPWSWGTRAVRFLSAGGDLALTVDPRSVPVMYDAVLARARTHPAFRARVGDAALHVLELKQARGLL